MKNLKALLELCELHHYILELFFAPDDDTYRIKVKGFKEFQAPYYKESFFEYWRSDTDLEALCKKILKYIEEFDDRLPMRIE